MFGFRNNKPRALFDVVRLLAPLVENDSPHNFGTGSTIEFRGDAEVLTWLLTQSNYLEQRPSQKECLDLAFKLCPVSFQPNLASLILIALREFEISPTISNAKDEFKNTLLHYLAWNLGERCAMDHASYLEIWSRTSSSSQGPNPSEFYTQVRALDPQLSDLLNLIRDLAQHSKNLHSVNVAGFTPLLFLFFGYMAISDLGCGGYFHEFPPQQRNAPVSGTSLTAHLFLSALHSSSGISLSTYGMYERAAHARDYAIYPESEWTTTYQFLEWQKKIGDEDEAQEIRRSEWRFISFVSGQEVADWRFWFVEILNDDFADFWHMVEVEEEHPENAWVPGGLGRG